MTPPPLPQTIIAVSTKMYFDLPTTAAYLSALPLPPPSTALIILPSFPFLPIASSAIAQKLSSQSNSQNKGPQLLLGAQNCSSHDLGAYTGEVSPLQLAQLGCTVVELGHAERRAPPFNEDNALTAKKALAATKNGLIPLVCIGEKKRSQIVSEGVGMAISQCWEQVACVLNLLESEGDVADPEMKQLIFAYEPVWAIGSAEPAGADHVLAVLEGLKKSVDRREWSGKVRWLYGGSAGPGTWGKLRQGCDGLFLGRFAHEIKNLEKVLMEATEGHNLENT